MKKYFGLVSIFAGGLLLRFWNLTSISLWHDEAFSALLIKYSWGEMMYRIGLDVHPPMYYIFLRFWHYIFGDALWSLRGMSVFFGIMTVVAVYALVNTAFKNKTAALLAALFVALSPFQIQYVTEARMYTMGAFFTVLAAYFLVKALQYQREVFSDERLNMPNLPQDIANHRAAMAYYVGFALSCAVMIYTHYYLLFSAAALCFYGLVYHVSHYGSRFKRYGLLLMSFVIIAVSYLPWLKTFMFQYRQVGAGYWIPPMDRWSIPSTLWQMLLGIGIDVGNPTTQKMLVAVTLFTLFVLYKFIRRTDFYEKWLVVAGLVAPFAGSVLFYALAQAKGSNSSVYLVRYFLYASSFYAIALAVWLSHVQTKWLMKCLVVAYAAVNLYTVYHYWAELKVSTKPGMAAAAEYLKMNVEPHHKIYVGSSFEFFNYKYYNQTLVRPLLYSGGNTEVHNLPHFAGTAILTNEDLQPNFNTNVKNGDTIWLLWTNGFGGSKPETPANWTLVDQKEYPEVRPYVGTVIYVDMYKVN